MTTKSPGKRKAANIWKGQRAASGLGEYYGSQNAPFHLLSLLSRTLQETSWSAGYAPLLLGNIPGMSWSCFPGKKLKPSDGI